MIDLLLPIVYQISGSCYGKQNRQRGFNRKHAKKGA